MFHEVFSSIWHNKFRTMLILILAVLTFFLTLTTLTRAFAFYTQLSDVVGMFPDDLENIYRVDALLIENEDTLGKDFVELKAFVNAQENSVCGAYDIVGTYFDELISDPQFLALNEKAYAGKKYEPFPATVDIVYIDLEILDILNFDLSGSDFQPIERDGERYIPLYAGSDFDGVLSVGDKLTLSDIGEKYIVSGFLDNEKWLNDDDMVTMPPVSLNHMFLAPFSELEMQHSVNELNMIQHATVGKILLDCPETVADEFNRRAAERGIKFNVTFLRTFTEDWKSDNEESLRLSLFLAAIVFLCSAISVISTLCVNILLKKKEYGIKIAFGCTKRKIVGSLCLEMILLNGVSGMIALGLGWRSFAGNIIESFREIYLRTLCSTSLLLLAGLIVIMIVIVLIVPIRLLTQYDPCVLIKDS